MDRQKQRYRFAMSAFVRMWGRGALNDIKIQQFCVEWSHKNVHAPLDNTVDQYFYYEFKSWRGY